MNPAPSSLTGEVSDETRKILNNSAYYLFHPAELDALIEGKITAATRQDKEKHDAEVAGMAEVEKQRAEQWGAQVASLRATIAEITEEKNKLQSEVDSLRKDERRSV